MVRFAPIVERTSVEAPPPWSVLGEGMPYRVRLSADMGAAEVGSVVWQLAQYNGVPVDGRSAREILQDIVRADSIALPGGVAVRDASGREILPGCCAGLEEWREWLAFEITGATPWMGHEPDPWLERVGDVVRVWSHGELSEAAIEPAFAIDVPVADFRRGLVDLRTDLEGFLGALGSWARRVSPAEADALVAKFDHAFEVSAGRDRDPVA